LLFLGAIVEINKLTFNLQELPEGKSERSVELLEEDLNLEVDIRFLGADLDVKFYKTNHFVEVKFHVKAKAGLLCDRSLKPFEKELEGRFQIVFDPNIEEESETEEGAIRHLSANDLRVDISKEVVDTIMLEIPIQKIHPDFFDEEGNPKKFETQTFGTSEDNEENIDPRWSELKKLK
jgi:uncharacterized metal-binding protein YceD (DUF177 family)